MDARYVQGRRIGQQPGLPRLNYHHIPDSEREVIHWMKERLSYVAANYEAEMDTALSTNTLERSYTLTNGHSISLNTEHFRSGELLFRPEWHVETYMAPINEEATRDYFGAHSRALYQATGDMGSEFGIVPKEIMEQIAAYDFCLGHQSRPIETSGLGELVKSCLEKEQDCLRYARMMNIVLSGGTCNMPGLDVRLGKELATILPDLKCSVITTGKSNHDKLAWRGGSMMAKCMYPKACVTREKYDEIGALAFNSPGDPSFAVTDEFPPVVADFGSCYTKFGYAGKELPQEWFSTLIGITKTNCHPYPKTIYVAKDAMKQRRRLDLTMPVFQGRILEDHHWDLLEKIASYGFHKVLKVSPDQYPFYICEDPLANYCYEQKMAEMSFETLNVPALAFGNKATLTLLTTNRETGCVVHIGDTGGYVVCINEGQMLSRTLERVPYGGRDVSDYLFKIVSERNV